jgi:putative transcriptional regulator
MSDAPNRLQGKLLLSVPALMDPNFRHTVVLVADHQEEGTVGVILNRPSETTVALGAPPLTEIVDTGDPLFEGGPIDPNTAVIVVEATDPEVLDIQVLGAIGVLTGEVDDALRDRIIRARVFAGHAAWGPGQLESELAEGAWIVEDATPLDIFAPDPAILWQTMLRRKGPPFDRMARIPFDLRTN